MRFVIAVMRHETNTFSPLPTRWRDFGRGMGDGPALGEAAIAAMAGTNNPVAAYLDVARERGAEIVFPVAANASPSGLVTDEAFEAIAGRIVDAVAAGCDAVLLDLHGAMVTESLDDGEGELLRRIRAVAPDVPLCVALDFHANMTAAMIDHADVVTGYRTYPHVDMYQTGARAARTLMRMLDGEVRPVMAWKSLPMLTHMLRQTPSQQPMKDVMDRAIAAEDGGEVLNASVFGGFPLADIPHVGLAAVVVADGAAGGAGAAADLRDELLRMAWGRRADFIYPIEPMADSIARAARIEGGPVILADHGDNTASGGTQDVMAVLAEALRQGLRDLAAGPFCDPVAVARMHEAGVGAELELEIGGRIDMPALQLKGEPLRLKGRVKTLADGRFTVTGPMMTGMQLRIGRSAVLDTGAAEILVSEERMEPFDLGIFTHAGIDPRTKRFVLLKSRQHFRAGFEPIAREIVMVAGPGVCSSDYSLFPFRNLRRPIYPLDEDLQAM